MTKNQLIKELKEAYQEFELEHGKTRTFIMPRGQEMFDIFVNDEEEINCNLDELLRLRLYDGKTLLDICDDIVEFEYI